MNITPFITKHYEDFRPHSAKKRTQNEPNSNPISGGKTGPVRRFFKSAYQAAFILNKKGGSLIVATASQTPALETSAPDFFLFGRERKLVYRGQKDDNRPGNNIPVTELDLIKAMNSVLAGTW